MIGSPVGPGSLVSQDYSGAKVKLVSNSNVGAFSSPQTFLGQFQQVFFLNQFYWQDNIFGEISKQATKQGSPNMAHKMFIYTYVIVEQILKLSSFVCLTYR